MFKPSTTEFATALSRLHYALFKSIADLMRTFANRCSELSEASPKLLSLMALLLLSRKIEHEALSVDGDPVAEFEDDKKEVPLE